MLNPFQRACVRTYAGGDFAHVQNLDEAREVGDTLFLFLMIELSSEEGCDCPEEAGRRLANAIADLTIVAEAVQCGPEAAY